MSDIVRLESLDALDFAAVLSDLDGIVYRGDTAVAGAVDRFNLWHDRGIPYAFVTNNAERPASAVAAKLRGLGIACGDAQVVTSGDVALDHIGSHYAPGSGIYVIGSASLKDQVAATGFRLVDHAADAVLVALDRSFDYAMMKTALRNILAGADLIGTNPDLIRPVSDGFEPGAGAITQSIAASSGATPIFLGKPEPQIIQTALMRLGVTAASAIMLGDQLDTDILAGQRAGVRSVFVDTGVPLNTKSPVRPDYRLAQL